MIQPENKKFRGAQRIVLHSSAVKGFTLIELLVAVAVFSIIIVAISGIFSFIIKAQRTIVGTQNAQEPARYLLETMAKEIRMSTINTETTTDPEGDLSLGITNSREEGVVYAFNGSVLTRNGSIVSPGTVDVTGKFFTIGMDEDSTQGKVTIVMKIKSRNSQPEYQTEINLQTTISSRGH